ncbi:MAG: diphthine synthase [Nanoarchaeota archaeon]|nr:diphthine synthase [Nanoarchaeota archaeon]
MLCIIGLGLNEEGISKEGLEAIKRCKKVYLESYTAELPYSVEKIAEIIDKKIIPADREFVESCKIVDEAKKMNVALLVYGSPLSATTHITLIQEAKKMKIKCRVIYSASIFDAIAETGLQPYKFGKTTSIPEWTADYKPESFAELIMENQKINAHTLLLVNPGMDLTKALNQLEIACNNYEVKLDKIVICSRLGTNEKRVVYGLLESVKKIKIDAPFCIIIPGKLHFVEEEVLESF